MINRRDIVRKAEELIHAIEPDAEVILFGSEARGDARQRDDRRRSLRSGRGARRAPGADGAPGAGGHRPGAGKAGQRPGAECAAALHRGGNRRRRL